MKKVMKKKQGFTLTEILVVFSIMGIIGTMMFAGYTRYVDKSKASVTEYELVQIKKAIDLEIADGDLKSYADVDQSVLTTVYNGIFNKPLAATEALTYTNKVMTLTKRGYNVSYNFETDKYNSVKATS